MQGIIFSGGEISGEIKKYISEDAFIICADSGYDSAKRAGILPAVLIGDMDSISHIPNDVEILRVNIKKNETDTQLCIDYMSEKGIDDVLLFGALGGRYDHAFANIMLLSYGLKKGVNLKIVSPPEEMFLIKDSKLIKGETGDILSLFPIAGNAGGVLTCGLEYPLKRETLYYDMPRGISNVFIRNEANVSLSDGLLLAIHIKTGGETNW